MSTISSQMQQIQSELQQLNAAAKAFKQEMQEQATLSNEQTAVHSALEAPAAKPHKHPTAEGGATAPVSGAVAMLVALAGLMDTNQKVMGSDTAIMGALQPQINALNEELQAMNNQAGGLNKNLFFKGFSGEDANLYTMAMNEENTVANAKLTNTMTEAQQEGMSFNGMSEMTSADGALAQSIISNVIDQQARGMQ